MYVKYVIAQVIQENVEALIDIVQVRVLCIFYTARLYITWFYKTALRVNEE